MKKLVIRAVLTILLVLAIPISAFADGTASSSTYKGNGSADEKVILFQGKLVPEGVDETDVGVMSVFDYGFWFECEGSGYDLICGWRATTDDDDYFTKVELDMTYWTKFMGSWINAGSSNGFHYDVNIATDEITDQDTENFVGANGEYKAEIEGYFTTRDRGRLKLVGWTTDYVTSNTVTLPQS